MNENTGKQVAVGLAVALVAYALWEGVLRKYWFDWLDDGTFNKSSDGVGGSGSSWGTGGSGSGSGSGGAGGAGSGAGGAGSGAGGGAGSGSGGSGAGGAGSGSGGAGGAGGAGTGAVGDYSSLAAAINALAAGVRLPNLQTASMTVASGTTALVPGIGGKRTCVLAYAVVAAGTVTCSLVDGNAAGNLWSMPLDTPTGNSGANLATSWPGYLFATSGGQALNVTTNGAATVSVTYWQEDE